MKKKIVSLLLAATMIAGLCACGSSNDPVNAKPSAGEEASGNTTTVSDGGDTDSTTTGNEGNTSDNANAVSGGSSVEGSFAETGLLEAFLNNEIPATLGEGSAFLYYDEDYYFSDYIHGYLAAAASDWNDVEVTSISYAYVDAAKDGVADLAVKIILNCEYAGDMTYNLLFVQAGEKLVLAADGYGYYRSESTINKSGVIQTGGSDGATSYGYTYCTADSNGEYRNLYSLYVDMGYEYPIIPAYAFEDYEAIPDGYPDDFTDTNYYEISRYTFGRYEDTRTYYVINKEDGTEVSPMEEYADLYAQQGINAVSGDLIDDLIDRELGALNLTRDDLLETEPEWTSLDISKYADVYGNEWTSGYRSFVVTNGCVDFLREPYELMYSYEPLALYGYTLAELTGDDVPELLVLYTSIFSVNAQVISIYTYNDEKKTVELLNTVTNEGSAKGWYSDYAPADSFIMQVANNYNCVAGLTSDGELVLFGNWGDGYFSFEMKTVSFKGEEKSDSVFSEYHFFESGYDEQYGDKDKAQEIFETYRPLMFFEPYEVEYYFNEDYRDSNIYDFSADQVQQVLIDDYNYNIDYSSNYIWDGVVVSEDDNIYFSRSNMKQYHYFSEY